MLILLLLANRARRERRYDDAPREIGEVQRRAFAALEDRRARLRQDAGAELVRFERVGELLHYRDGRTAAPRLWLAHRLVPNAPRDAQFLAVEVFPHEAAKLAMANPGERAGKHNCMGRLREHAEHRLDLAQGVSVSVLFRLRRVGNRNVHDRIDAVENAEPLRLLECAGEKRLAMMQRAAV